MHHPHAGRVLSLLLATSLTLPFTPAQAAGRRKVIISQDSRGPATSDLQAIALLLQTPDAEVLGITVVSGDVWRDDGVAHALRLVEVMGRTDVPVVPGSVYPLVHTKAESDLWEKSYGKQVFTGAWLNNPPVFVYHEPDRVPPLVEGEPATKASTEIAANFLVRQVRAHPGEVTIISVGPLTDVALAIRLDPEFPKLARELVFMGGSFSPPLDNYFSAEYQNNPRHEFNMWWDAEAARIALRAPWKKIVCTPVDISLKTKYTPEIADRMAQAGTPFTEYLRKYAELNFPMWDELAVAAWVDPSIITRRQTLYMDIDCDHGAGYGNTLSWTPGSQPGLGEQAVEINADLNNDRFAELYVEAMGRPSGR